MQEEVRKAEGSSTPESAKSKKKKEDEEKLAQIYESFQFDGLWDKLSEALSRMEDDSSAAMILLPLIEVSCIELAMMSFIFSNAQSRFPPLLPWFHRV